MSERFRGETLLGAILVGVEEAERREQQHVVACHLPSAAGAVTSSRPQDEHSLPWHYGKESQNAGPVRQNAKAKHRAEGGSKLERRDRRREINPQDYRHFTDMYLIHKSAY